MKYIFVFLQIVITQTMYNFDFSKLGYNIIYIHNKIIWSAWLCTNIYNFGQLEHGVVEKLKAKHAMDL